jgi:hypothetical protein
MATSDQNRLCARAPRIVRARQGRQELVESWVNREGRTLAVIVEHFARPGADRLWLSELAELTGVAEPELEHRLDRLAASEFIGVDRRASAIAGVVEVLPKGWRAGTVEPNAQGAAVEILVGQLGMAVEQETEPTRRSVLSDLLIAVRTFSREFGPETSAELLAKWTKIG